MGWFPLGLGLVIIMEDRPSCWYLITGPPPTKKSRLQSDESAFSIPPTKKSRLQSDESSFSTPLTIKHRLQSDESAFSTDPSASQMSSKANNTSLAGPSSAALTRVPKTEAAIGLDAKLGML